MRALPAFTTSCNDLSVASVNDSARREEVVIATKVSLLAGSNTPTSSPRACFCCTTPENWTSSCRWQSASSPSSR
jgi:hypothetical protein